MESMYLVGHKRYSYLVLKGKKVSETNNSTDFFCIFVENMNIDLEEIRINVAISCIQGVLEAKGGFVGEISPTIAVAESFRIADEFVKQYQERYIDKKQ